MREDRTPRNGLGITDWALRPDEVDRVGLDAPGIMFAGWWRSHPPAVSAFDSFATCWPPDCATFKYRVESLKEIGGEGYQAFAYVRILHYPEAWTSVIAKSLEFFTNRGAAIAWAGGYECFVRYRVGDKLKGCYAAFTSKGGLICLGGLDEPLRYIDEDPQTVNRLHTIVATGEPTPPTR